LGTRKAIRICFVGVFALFLAGCSSCALSDSTDADVTPQTDAAEAGTSDIADDSDGQTGPVIVHDPCTPELDLPRRVLRRVYSQSSLDEVDLDVSSSDSTVVASVRGELVSFRRDDDGVLVEADTFRPRWNATPTDVKRVEMSGNRVFALARQSGDIAVIDIESDGMFGEYQWLGLRGTDFALSGEHVFMLETNDQFVVSAASSYDVSDPERPVREWTIQADRDSLIAAVDGYAILTRTSQTFWQLRSMDLDGGTSRAVDAFEPERSPVRLRAGHGRVLLTLEHERPGRYGDTIELTVENGRFASESLVAGSGRPAFGLTSDYNVVELRTGTLVFTHPGGSDFAFAHTSTDEPVEMTELGETVVFADTLRGLTAYDLGVNVEHDFVPTALEQVDTNQIVFDLPFVFYLVADELFVARVENAIWELVDSIEFDQSMQLMAVGEEQLFLTHALPPEGDEGWLVGFDGRRLTKQTPFVIPHEADDVSRGPAGWWMEDDFVHVMPDGTTDTVVQTETGDVDYIEVVDDKLIVFRDDSVEVLSLVDGSVDTSLLEVTYSPDSVRVRSTVELSNGLGYIADRDLHRLDLATTPPTVTRMTENQLSLGFHADGVQIGDALFIGNRVSEDWFAEVSRLEGARADGYFAFAPGEENYVPHAHRDGLLYVVSPFGDQGASEIGVLSLCE
jgi:hypothetical protein